MGGSKQPYMYQPVTHSPFNPKAYTQSLANPPPPRAPKPDGPLLTFNRHPDSYDNLPYGRNMAVEQMSSRTKKMIIWSRKIQLFWRVLQLCVAVGVLVLVIMLKGVPDTQSWILRLPPAFDLFVSAYAIWHLSHSATQRPPQSAASYHAFCLIMDIGLIPFYAFTGILTKQQFETATGTEGRWRSMIADEGTTNEIFHILWLGGFVAAGLHAVSIFIDAYLVMKFRQIASMPPDMNPLEDHYTSRRATKHKYKNSDMSTLLGEEKRFSEISARTKRSDDVDPFRASTTSEKLMGDKRSSGVSFFHSRDGGHVNTYSAHTPESARQSWQVNDPSFYQEPSVYQQPSPTRQSRADVDRTKSTPQYGNSRVYSPMPGMPKISKRHSAQSPIPVYDDSASTVDGSNWEVIEPAEESRDSGDFDPYRSGTGHLAAPPASAKSAKYSPVAQAEDPSSILRMNPPTPEPSPRAITHQETHSPLARLSEGYQEHNKENSGQAHDDGRTNTILSNSSSQYSESEPALSTVSMAPSQPGASKSRFYTDLAAAMRGVRHNPPAKGPQSVAGSVHTHLSASTAASSSHHHSRVQPATAGDKRIKASGTVVKKPLKPSLGESGFSVAKSSPSRVVSRTGADVEVMDFGTDGDLGLGGMRKNRRDVSGKVAEEGRGGGLWRRISGRVPSQ